MYCYTDSVGIIHYLIMFREALLQSLPLLLTPLAGLLVRQGVKFPELLPLLKKAFIDAARDQLEIEGKKVTSSRLSAMTGLHRPDIGKLLDDNKSQKPVDYLQRIVWNWQSNPEFRTKQGKGRVLSVKGAESEFAALVRSVSTALNPYTVLFELERSGQIEKTDRGVKLASAEYLGDRSAKQGLHFLGQDLEDLIRCVEGNRFGTTAAINHHITTEYDEIPAENAESIRKWLLEHGRRLHDKMRQHFATAESECASSEKVRVVFGSFGRVESV